MYTYNRVSSICIDLSKIKLFVFVFVFVNILNHGNTQQKLFPNFCRITPTAYHKR